MEAVRSWWSAQRADAESWCHERSALVRIPLLIWLAAILIYLWRDPSQRGLFDWPNLFSGINLGIHELGHVAFAPLGTFMGILGGSLAQCLAPLAGMVSLRRQSDWFGLSVCGGWLATNLFGVAAYMGDARAMALPLVSPFSGHPIHDWNWLLSDLGWLDACDELALATRLLAALVMATSLGFGSWLVGCMFRQR